MERGRIPGSPSSAPSRIPTSSPSGHSFAEQARAADRAERLHASVLGPVDADQLLARSSRKPRAAPAPASRRRRPSACGSASSGSGWPRETAPSPRSARRRRGTSRRAGCRHLAPAWRCDDYHSSRASPHPGDLLASKAEKAEHSPMARPHVTARWLAHGRGLGASVEAARPRHATIDFGFRPHRTRLLDRRRPPRRRARLPALHPPASDHAPLRLGPRALRGRGAQEHEPGRRRTRACTG